MGYRSVHYILDSSLTKKTRKVELQVRTIFEEGWSEVDHKIRYPRISDDKVLSQYLTDFNLLAGLADSMSDFVFVLKGVASRNGKNRTLRILSKNGNVYGT
jgi:putative GTP pyrophosphokinase